HQDDGLRTLGDRLQRVADRGTGLADIRRQPTLAEYKELVPTLDQVEGHRMTHNPEPDKADFHDHSRHRGKLYRRTLHQPGRSLKPGPRVTPASQTTRNIRPAP